MQQVHTLKYVCDNHTVEFTTTGAVTLYEQLQTFENFLRAIGYVIDGTLDIIKEEPLCNHEF